MIYISFEYSEVKCVDRVRLGFYIFLEVGAHGAYAEVTCDKLVVVF